MTLGITGVFWLPRTATVNSTTLWAGAGPIPLSSAAPAWTQIAAAYADASLTLTRVLAELAVGWQGITATAALARVTGFKVWADQATATATVLASKSAANSIASTTARVVMPSLPEIAAVKTAKVAAYSTGGVLNGTAEAAEVADRAMDIRAAVVMEVYEAATTTVVVTPTEFTPPPALANGAGAVTSSETAGQEGQVVVTDPVHAAGLAAAAFAQNPAVQAAASQAGQIAGSVASTAVSTATNVGTSMLSASTAVTAPAASTPFVGAPIGASIGVGQQGANATRSVAYSGSPSSNVVLPDGWGTNNLVGTNTGTGVPGTNPAAASSIATADPGTSARNAPMGPVAGHPRGAAQQDDDHETPDYLKKFEHFADGRTVIPAVIGAEPASR